MNQYQRERGVVVLATGLTERQGPWPRWMKNTQATENSECLVSHSSLILSHLEV